VIETLENKIKEAQQDVRHAYGDAYWRDVLDKTVKRMNLMAGDPQQAVDAILHAVESRRPKTMYVLGADGKLFYQLHRSPQKIADMFINLSGKTRPAAMESKGTSQIEFTALCPADPKTTWKHFLEELWLKGAALTPSLTVENAGDETGNGATRWVPVLGKRGIREGITFTKHPEYLRYSVMDLSSSAFPVKVHRGRVDFIPWAEGKTHIVWSVEYTPKKGASLIVKMVFGYVIPRYLNALVRKCDHLS